jgi:heterotetrameric sarcosine oxidase gamma subunit
VSAPSPVSSFAGILRGAWSPQILEVAAFRTGGAAIARQGALLGEPPAAPGKCAFVGQRLSLCARPLRWLFLRAPEDDAPAAARQWQEGCRDCAAVVNLSSALAAFLLGGARVTEMLARGCRLDLHPQVFPPGSAAATVMAQVPVTLAALPHCMLLLSPATTARHLAEWLETTSGPFGASGNLDIDALFSGEMTTRYP